MQLARGRERGPGDQHGLTGSGSPNDSSSTAPNTAV
jgi:hypothetical protein